MKTNLFLLLYISTLFSSCQHFNNDDNSIPLLWVTKVKDQNFVVSKGETRSNLYYDNKIIAKGWMDAETPVLYGIDVSDGHIVWTWKDYLKRHDNTASVYHRTIFNNIFRFSNASRHYSINLDNGTTVFRDSSIHCMPEQHSIGSNFYIPSTQLDSFPGYEYNVGCIGSFSSADLIPTVYPPLQFDTLGERNTIGTIWRFLPHEIDGHLYYLVQYGITYPNYNFTPKLGLYDPTTKSYVYKDAWTVEPSQTRSCTSFVIVGDRVYFDTGSNIVCHNIATGLQVWSKKLPHTLFFSGFALHGNKLIANCENNVLYCLDLNTGNTLWEGEGSGTSSTVEGCVLNDVIYYKGGANGDLIGVDVNTGKTLMKLNNNDYIVDNYNWSSECYVVPGVNGNKGRIVVCSETHVYCFEAVR
jgi:outer membrane protein assembly factor BamB